MMKQPILTIIALLMIFQQNFAQQTPADKVALFRNDVLPQYSTYFTNADLNENGQLILSASGSYKTLAINSKKVILDNLVRKWSESLIIIQYDSKCELWGSNVETGRAIRIDSWDINATNINASSPMALSGTGKHPFFVYGGGQGVLDSDHNLNVSINARVGFFLLKNKWDLAWCLSGGIFGSVDTSAASSMLSVGLMSKYYFPIPKLKISPSVGIDLESVTVSDPDGNSSNNATQSLLLGISWYVGPGSLDVGYRINKAASSLTIGYTFMPGVNRKKKR